MNDPEDWDQEDSRYVVSRAAAVVVMVSGMLALIQCGPPRLAYGQHTDDGLTLARLACHESGWHHPEEAAAIYAVAVYGAERTGMTWQRWLAVHSPRFAAGTVDRDWVYRLTREAHDPVAGISWRTHRPLWLAYLAAADAAINAEPVCVAATWGSVDDLARLRASGRFYTVRDCGVTRNSFISWGRQ